MERWLRSEEAENHAKVGVVLVDALRGLEHVHSHGIVHCDVKPANVLLKEQQADGLRRAVLADFDLSYDESERPGKQISMLAASSSMSMVGQRGTPGVLTLAPEVMVSGREPTMKSDMFSFGGMMLLALHKARALAWEACGDSERWDGAGRAQLTDVSGLTQRLLSRDPLLRPSSTEALADDALAAMGAAVQSEASKALVSLVHETELFREEKARFEAATMQQRDAFAAGACGVASLLLFLFVSFSLFFFYLVVSSS